MKYASRKLTSSEQNYATTWKEGLACVYGVHYFCYYLLGHKFILITDHKPLQYIMTIKKDKSLLTRWATILQAYDFQVVYREGKSNTNADALSRNPPECNVLRQKSEEISLCLHLSVGDLTQQRVDAIVNPANKGLQGGGSVDGDINLLAGPQLLEECTLLNECRPGDTKITHGHRLKAKYIIHTVGPQNEDESTLANCYKNCLNVATLNQVETIAFPCIAKGAYGFPKYTVIRVAITSMNEWWQENQDKTSLKRIHIVAYSEGDLQ